jgi:protein SCO1/2
LRDARSASRSRISRRCSRRCSSIITFASSRNTSCLRAGFPLARLVACALLACAFATGCGERQSAKFELTDVTGAAFGKKLELTDQNGQRRTLADFKGKVVVVFFGFTHCPDACPTTLSELATVAQNLGPDASRLQVLVVTVDPERDTPEVLRQYVTSFNPTFLGLTGTQEEVTAAAKEFKVYFQKQPQPGGSYTVDHSAGTFVLDKEGRLRLFGQYGAGAKALLHDIRVLLAE